MRVTELPHVLGATEGFDHRGQMLRIVTDLPRRHEALGHDTEKMGLQKAIERVPQTAHCCPPHARTRPPGWS